jgi:hypothetical protein
MTDRVQEIVRNARELAPKVERLAAKIMSQRRHVRTYLRPFLLSFPKEQNMLRGEDAITRLVHCLDREKCHE